MDGLFSQELKEILDRPVDAENIGTYEDTVSNDLIRLIGLVGSEFGAQEGTSYVSENEFEDAALERFGLPSVDEVLDIIQNRIDMVRAAGEFMTERAVEIDAIITPPDYGSVRESGGNSPEKFEQIGLKGRVQTALYVLQKLGIDLDQVSLIYGQIDPDMMRENSYYTLEIPELGKMLQICDEERNASYIFSATVMADLGLTVEDLNDLTKQEKNELISSYRNRGLGYRFIYQPDWAGKLGDLVQADESQLAELAQQSYEAAHWTSRLRAPKAPKGYLSIHGLAKEAGVAHKTVTDIIKREGIELDVYLFGPQTVRGISPILQKILKTYPELKIKHASEDIVSVKQFAIIIGVAREKLDEIIATAEIPTPDYKFGPKIAPGLSPQDQQRIRKIQAGDTPAATQEIVSVEQFAKTHNIGIGTANSILQELGIEPGQYRFRTMAGRGLTPQQQAQALKHPYMDITRAAEDIISLSKLAKQLHSSGSYLEELAEELGIVPGQYKFRGAVGTGFDEEQKAQITSLLRERRPELSEGAMTFQALREETGASYMLVENVVFDLGVEPTITMSKTRQAKTVPADRVEAVRAEIQKRRQPRTQ